MEWADLHGGLNKKYIAKLIIFGAGFDSQGVRSKDPAICLDVAKPPPRYVSKYIKIIIAKLYIKDAWLGNKTNQRWKLPNRFAQGIILLQPYFASWVTAWN